MALFVKSIAIHFKIMFLKHFLSTWKDYLQGGSKGDNHKELII